MKTFAIINQKGGTGKTTVAINLSTRLAELGWRILLIDIDPQGNATSGSGLDKRKIKGGTYEVLSGLPAKQYLITDTSGGYSLLGTNSGLAGANIELAQQEDWQTRLKEALLPLADDFDFVLIDCPPALGVLTVNALVAAERILIPMQCEYFALEGLTDLAETVRHLRKELNPSIYIAGIIRSVLDSRNLLSRNISDELQRHFGKRLFTSTIKRNVRVAEAPSHGLPVLRYAPNSPGAEGYRRLGDEFLERFV